MKENQKKVENQKEKKEKRETKKISNATKFTIMAVILIAIFCIALTPVTLQNDTYYTIKIGEHIAQYGVDMQDPFSWHQELSYTYPHWGYDLMTYFIYSAFGMAGIYVTTCLLAIILGISIYFVSTKLTKNQILSFIVTIGAMYLLRGYIAARAQLVTFILFILTIYLIERFLETKKKRYGVGLVAIPIIIANVHLAVFPFYFVLYLPYLAEYFLASLSETIIYRKTSVRQLKRKIKKLSKQPEKQEKVVELKQKLNELEAKIDQVKMKRSKELQNPYRIKMVKRDGAKWLIIIFIICTLTGFLTPLGLTPYTYLTKTMEGNTTQNINEHLPMTLANDTDVICTLILFLAILIFTKAKIRLSDLLMLGGLCYLMLVTRRQVSMFAIVCSIILVRLLIQVFSDYTKIDWKEVMKKWVTPIGILITAIAMLGLSYYFGKDKMDEKYVDESTYPVAACDYIIQNIDIGQARFYNEYNYGSYMIFRGIPVFIDSRADLYAPEFSGKEDDIFMDFIETSGISKFYEDVFEKYDITHVITYKNSKMNMIITKTKDENYKELYQDDHFVIYQRLNG